MRGEGVEWLTQRQVQPTKRCCYTRGTRYSRPQGLMLAAVPVRLRVRMRRQRIPSSPARRRPGPNHLNSGLAHPKDMSHPLETGPSLTKPRERPWNPADGRHEPLLRLSATPCRTKHPSSSTHREPPSET
ncbi:hypothetical protein LZ30DRAFT_741613 [Colletotrichum cereale]|nr:hypothetical protein LZ30DRAFT_741613 [Colletotrichum cereale]